MNTGKDERQFLTVAEAVSLLRSVATSLRRSGANREAEKFEKIAGGLEVAASEELRTARLEKYKSQLAEWEARVKYDWDWRLESFKGTLALGQRTISSAMIVNGGAAIALLAYMGNTRSTAAGFIVPLAWFSIGVLMAAITFTLSYLSQLFYTDDEEPKIQIGRRFHYAAFIAALSSFVVFAGGIVATQFAFSQVSTSARVTVETERRNAPPPRAPGPAPDYPAQPVQTPTTPATPVKPATKSD